MERITLNQIITETVIALKTDKSLDKLIEKYSEEQVADALQFITYEQQEIIEMEEDYEENILVSRKSK